MANKTSNHRHPQGKNMAQGGQSSPSESWPETAHEYMDTAQEYAADVADQASEYWSQGRERIRGAVRGREGTTVMLAVAAGVGVGLLIGAALGRSHAQQQSSSARKTAEQFGKRLMDRIEGMIPEALSEHFTRS